MNTLTYKNYHGVFEYDQEADIFHGDIINLTDVITFEGRSIDELKQALADSVEDYLDFCKSEGKEPQKPFSGRFNVRLSPELHQQIVIKATESNQSLNSWITHTLEQAVR